MNAVLQAYRQHGQSDGDTREARVRAYLPLVRRQALRMARTLPSTVDINDLVSAGCLGLLFALERFDPQRGLDFETYAEYRIKGAILDELRALDPLSRRQRQRLRQVERCRRNLRQTLGREPSDEEMAEGLGLDVSEWQELAASLGPGGELSLVLLSLDKSNPAADGEQRPDRRLQQRQLRQALVAALRRLPERLRTVMSLYYYARLNYKEIAQLLGVSESRVCQLHRRAVLRIREHFAANDQE